MLKLLQDVSVYVWSEMVHVTPELIAVVVFINTCIIHVQYIKIDIKQTLLKINVNFS